jgi:DNA polymerase III alpha subunit
VARAVVRDTGRGMEMSYAEVDKIAEWFRRTALLSTRRWSSLT